MKRGRAAVDATFPPAWPDWRCRTNVWRGRTSLATNLVAFNGDVMQPFYIWKTLTRSH